MTARVALFGVGACGVAALYAVAIRELPGPHASPYGEAVNASAPGERHVSNTVSAVNFDYRGFDTLGEEFILFVSVLGASVLLREAHERRRRIRIDAVDRRRKVGATATVKVWLLAMTGPTVLFGLYVVLHGQLTPGGGFQGGVILATAALLIYLVESFDVFKRLTSMHALEIAEAIGVGAYAAVGAAGWIAGGAFLANLLPLGPASPPNLLSGGTMPVISFATGLAVAAGFTLVLSAFLQDLLTAEDAG